MADFIHLKISRRDALIDFIAKMRQRVSPDSTAVQVALTRAAFLITNQAKINIRQQRLIDTGRLLNSVRHEFFRTEEGQGVRVGSFGVSYAAIHEFGFQGSVRVRGHTRLMTKAFGRVLQKPVVARVSPHVRQMRMPARPYLGPAFERHKDRVAEIISEALRKR